LSPIQEEIDQHTYNLSSKRVIYWWLFHKLF
jgi:hypothetical protein